MTIGICKRCKRESLIYAKGICNSCYSVINRNMKKWRISYGKYRKRNKKKIQAYYKEYYKKNREKAIEYGKRYWKEVYRFKGKPKVRIRQESG